MGAYLQHQREIAVSVNDTDFNRRLKPSAVMGYFQDIAAEHANIMGIGYDNLIGRESVWVMARMSFIMLKTAKTGETLTVSTFPEKPKISDVDRGYYISDRADNIIAEASSKWCVLDANTHKIKRLTPIFEKFGDGAYMPDPFNNRDFNKKVEKLSEGARPEPHTFVVQVTDLDYNGHMNNARYGDVILNALGGEVLRENLVSRVDINFLSQLFIGEEYKVYKERRDDGAFLIEARKTGSGAAVFRARTVVLPA